MSALKNTDVACFLRIQGASSLLEYLNLPAGASASDCDQSLRERRIWAQQQRNNPKHRAEADWFLRNYRLMRDDLVHRPQEREAKAQRRTLMAEELQGICTPEVAEAMLALSSVSEDGSAVRRSEPAAMRSVDRSRYAHIPGQLVDGLLRMGASSHLTQRQMMLLLQDEEQWWQGDDSARR